MTPLSCHQSHNTPLHEVKEVEQELLIFAENLLGLPHVELQLGKVPGRLELLIEQPLECDPAITGSLM